MPNGKSRRKGKVGELDFGHRLGTGKRTGHAFLPNPDWTTDFAVYSVKNRTLGGGTILSELEKLQKQAPEHHHYVAFKAKRGTWVIAELLSQHRDDHGEKIPKEKLES